MNNLHTLLVNDIPAISGTLNQINWGGCGQFALQLHKALARKGIDSDIVLVKWSWYDAGSVKHMIKHQGVTTINEAYRQMFKHSNSVSTNACMGHIGVRVEGTIYDSDGVLDKPAISEHIEEDVMALALACRNGWNPEFLTCNNMSRQEADTVFDTHFNNALSKLSVSEVVA